MVRENSKLRPRSPQSAPIKRVRDIEVRIWSVSFFGLSNLAYIIR